MWKQLEPTGRRNVILEYLNLLDPIFINYPQNDEAILYLGILEPISIAIRG